VAQSQLCHKFTANLPSGFQSRAISPAYLLFIDTGKKTQEKPMYTLFRDTAKYFLAVAAAAAVGMGNARPAQADPGGELIGYLAVAATGAAQLGTTGYFTLENIGSGLSSNPTSKDFALAEVITSSLFLAADIGSLAWLAASGHLDGGAKKPVGIAFAILAAPTIFSLAYGGWVLSQPAQPQLGPSGYYPASSGGYSYPPGYYYYAQAKAPALPAVTPVSHATLAPSLLGGKALGLQFAIPLR
jgi:hypothetical protein